MATNETHVGTSHNLLNYFGLLFNKGNTGTPFFNSLAKAMQTSNWEFPTSIDFTSGGGTSQPAITETASLTAPTPSFVSRTQQKNFAQIFQYAYSLSYGKLSASGKLSGINTANTSANPADEMAFQAAQKLIEMRNDMEYSFLNGAKQDGTHDDVAYKTQGITGAITTNTLAAGSAELDYWMVAEIVEKIAAAFGDTRNLILSARSINLLQLNASCAKNGIAVLPTDRFIAGLRVQTLVTPFGDVSILPNERVAQGVALIYNPTICHPVFMPVPGKGIVFDEPLAKTGAAERRQVYAQAGLDYGAEWYHGKITGIKTSFTRPDGTVDVKVTNTTASPVNTKEVTA